MRYATAASRQIGSTIEQHYHLSLNSDVKANLFITTGADDVALLIARDAVAPRTWVHLAGTYDGMNVRLYVNGVEAAFQALTGSSPRPTPRPRHHWRERQRCHRRAYRASSPVVSTK